MCKMINMSWNLNGARWVNFSEVPDRAPDASERGKKVPIEIRPELDQVRYDVESTKSKGKVIEVETKEEAMRKKEALKNILVSKGASYDALSAFEQSYNPKVRDTIAKLIENAQPKLNVRDPKSWELIHETLMDKKSDRFYSQAYWDQYEPELAPLLPPLQVVDFSEADVEPIVSDAEDRVAKAVNARLLSQLKKLKAAKSSKVAVATNQPLPERSAVAISDEALRRAFGENAEAVDLFTKLKAKRPEAVKEAMAKFDDLVRQGQSSDVAREVVLAIWTQGLTEKEALAQVDSRRGGTDASASIRRTRLPK